MQIVLTKPHLGNVIGCFCIGFKRLARLRDQGLQLTVDVFGQPASIGFYNTFTARCASGTTIAGVEIAADPATGDVYALRGTGFASVQGHLESILSRDGMSTLHQLIEWALAPE